MSAMFQVAHRILLFQVAHRILLSPFKLLLESVSMVVRSQLQNTNNKTPQILSPIYYDLTV